MILTVHDELLFEAPKEEADAVAAVVKAKMSAAVPWIGWLVAALSAAARIWPFLLFSSGTRRRRP